MVQTSNTDGAVAVGSFWYVQYLKDVLQREVSQVTWVRWLWSMQDPFQPDSQYR